MTKIEIYEQKLLPLFEAYYRTDKSENLRAYIALNSNLPGPRANLELAHAFAEHVQEYSAKQGEKLYQLCLELIKISIEEAPTNNSGEFLPFCGANGIAAIGSVLPPYYNSALSTLRALANDPRWRIREAVCFGLQRLVAKRGWETLTKLEQWIFDGTLLELRAVAVAVAEPVLLTNEQIANMALHLHRQIFNRVQQTVDRQSEQFRILRKALGFSLSVLVCATPEQGFEFMHHLVNLKDADILWILKENLKKNRLIKNFPQEMESMKKLF